MTTAPIQLDPATIDALLTTARFGVIAPTLLLTHPAADHWVQTGHQATTKFTKDWAGRWACTMHVTTYTLFLAAVAVPVLLLLGLPIGWPWFIGGLVLNAATHWICDRREWLQRLAKLTGSDGLWFLWHFGRVIPEKDRRDPSKLGFGAWALDQSAHSLLFIPAALIMAQA